MATNKLRELSLQKKEKAVMAAKIRELALRKSKEKALTAAKNRESNLREKHRRLRQSEEEKLRLLKSEKQKEELFAEYLRSRVRKHLDEIQIIKGKKLPAARLKEQPTIILDPELTLEFAGRIQHIDSTLRRMKSEQERTREEEKTQMFDKWLEWSRKKWKNKFLVMSGRRPRYNEEEEKPMMYPEFYAEFADSIKAEESINRKKTQKAKLYIAWKSVLLRLPANDLICYKLVCKLWRRLIDSPEFRSDHFNLSKSDPSSRCFLFHEESPRSIFRSIPDPFRSVVFIVAPAVAVVGSVNGLICIVSELPEGNIWILNPVTGLILELPDPPYKPSPDSDYPYETVTFFFWFNEEDDEYKLVNIVSKPDKTTAAFLWVSSSPETWSEIPVGFDCPFYKPSPTVMVSRCDVVIRDVAYWFVFNLVGGGLHVLSLDLKTLSLSLSENPFRLHFVGPAAVCKRLSFDEDTGLCPPNNLLFAVNWKGEFALVERDEEKNMHKVWTMDEEGWRFESSFSEEFRIRRMIGDVNGKSLISRDVSRDYVYRTSVSFVEVLGTGGEGEEVMEGFEWSDTLTSAHDFVGSFVSIEGFKPQEAYGRKRLPPINVVWPYPSASETSSNSYLNPNFDRKLAKLQDERMASSFCTF